MDRYGTRRELSGRAQATGRGELAARDIEGEGRPLPDARSDRKLREKQSGRGRRRQLRWEFRRRFRERREYTFAGGTGGGSRTGQLRRVLHQCDRGRSADGRASCRERV